jgi:3-hydroxypropanoate dehydrogenase
MGTPLDDAALDAIFRQARTQNKWLDEPVSNDQLVALYDLMRWGPTSANCFPVRMVFVASPAAKERLKPLVLEGNRPKVMSAPVTAILGYDTRFYEWLPRLFPHADARSWFIDKPAFAEATAFRNSSLQEAYFIIAARALYQRMARPVGK